MKQDLMNFIENDDYYEACVCCKILEEWEKDVCLFRYN